jgi:hypothetical protein
LFLFFKTAKFDTKNRRGVLDTALYDKVCQWHAAGRWFSPDTPVSSTNKTDCHDISWNIVESGIKHQNPNPSIISCFNQCDIVPLYEVHVFRFESPWYSWKIAELALSNHSLTHSSYMFKYIENFAQNIYFTLPLDWCRWGHSRKCYWEVLWQDHTFPARSCMAPVRWKN